MKLLFTILELIISFIIMIYFLGWAIWFLPLVVAIVLFLINKDKYSINKFLIMIFISLSLVGIWSLFLYNFLNIFPNLLKYLLVLKLENNPSPIIIGRYILGGMNRSEFFGYISLASIGGFICLIIYLTIIFIGKLNIPRSYRVWALKISVIAIIGLGTFVVYLIDKDYTAIFGFIAYIIGIGYIVNNIDPKDEIEK